MVAPPTPPRSRTSVIVRPVFWVPRHTRLPHEITCVDIHPLGDEPLARYCVVVCPSATLSSRWGGGRSCPNFDPLPPTAA